VAGGAGGGPPGGEALRVVAVSNEYRAGVDPDIPWALERLKESGLVGVYRVYSMLPRVEAVGTTAAAAEVAALVRGLDAQVLAFFHTRSCLLDAGELEVVRSAGLGAVWIYQEYDPFHRWLEPYRRRALPTVSRCDAAFLFCGGYLADVVRRAGCGFVTYAPMWVNTERFPQVWRVPERADCDAVFVGNNVRSRRRPFPGARQRARLVERLQARYGSRAAIYGRGWQGLGAKGPIPIDEVSEAYSRARVCVGIDHSVGPFQFSDRLPIALATGIPLVHSDFAGSAEVLPGLDSRQLFRDPDGAVMAIDRILEMDEPAVTALSAAQHGVAETVSCDRVMGYMLLAAAALRNGADPRRVPNPWLADAHQRL
jgi:hypothetical protein